MSASIKYWNRNKDVVKDVETAIKHIKTALAKQNDNAKSVSINLMVCGHGAHPFGSASQSGDYIDFMIGIGQERIKDFGEHDLKEFYGKLQNELCKLQLTKEYSTLNFKWETIYPYVGGRDCELKVISQVSMLDNVCKEFTTLNKLLSKHSNKTIKATDWYNVDLFGKRGQYDESGKKRYQCYNADFCQRAIDTIRKHKTSKDTLTWSLVEYDDIDTAYSIRYETECYGYRQIKLHISIKTPTGRNKCDVMF